MRFCSELVLGTVVLANAILPLAKGETASPNSPTPRAVSVVRSDARTGRLVRSVVVKAKPADSDSPETDVRSMVEETAKNHDVSPFLVDSVIQVESNYNPYATSPKGAQGLMQLMPATARRFGVTNSFDAKQNIEGGVRYLKFLQDTFKDDRLAIAAYNAGEKAVAKYRDVPPYPETINYVAKVGKKYGQAKHAAGQDRVKDNHQVENEAKNAEEPRPVEEATRHILTYVDPEGKLHIATR